MNHTQAFSILEAGIAKASEMGVPMTIAVVDANTDLVAQVRMEGGMRFSVELARGKAMVSAVFQQPSAAVAGDGAAAAKLNKLSNDQMAFVQGAVPLRSGGTLIGAVGVSGATPEMDEAVATAAAAAVDG